YGILVEKGMLLVSDEFIKGKEITKLPGGGLEFGEGPADCVVREFKEELDLAVNVKSHFYTTDFFVTSAFNIDSQVLSIYYVVNPMEELKVNISIKKFDFKKRVEGAQSFRWLEMSKISENDFTFVIDRKVATLLAEQKKMFL
ncbi:MAG TPA: NUDIX domain-containing protein, partial [Bacteroidia bacterium]|nr:NUDIX domain-containing protein [Bacteroidia bacterium]